MEKKHLIAFYKGEIIVERVCANSGQAIVFFGRDCLMGIRVVLKQYKADQFKGIFRELKIFTYLEHEKKLEQGLSIQEVITKDSIHHDGLPCLLSYKIGSNFGEILMTNGGMCLEKWAVKIPSKARKMTFVLSMLK